MNNKKIFYVLILLLFLNLINIININAVTTSCEYSDLGLKVEYDEAGTSTILQTKYEEVNHQWPIVGWFYTKSYGSIEYVNELNHIKKELYGSCPESIYVCTYEKMIWGDLGVNAILDDFIPEGTFLEKDLAGIGVGAEDSAILGYTEHKKLFLYYSESNMKDNATLSSLPNKELVKGTEFIDNFENQIKAWDNICGGVCGWTLGLLGGAGENIWDLIGIDFSGDGGGIDVWYNEYKNCGYVDYTGSLPTYNLACPNLNIYLGYFNDSINNYKKCSENDAVCLSKTITNVNEKEDLIKSYCKAILQNYDFDKGEDEKGNEQACLEACLDIGVQTKKAKVAAGLISGDSGECGFSARLLVWLSNILRWIKYILPVIVIVMGILDFIKAIAAGKDDELKKAQGSFTKRLIAAALVFLIPLIVEFVLDKMGFGYDTCGLF